MLIIGKARQKVVNLPVARSTQKTALRIVEFVTSLLKRFDRRHPITADSHKTDGNSVRRTVRRKSCEFPVRARAWLIMPRRPSGC
jgi:hypothetical protein